MSDLDETLARIESRLDRLIEITDALIAPETEEDRAEDRLMKAEYHAKVRELRVEHPDLPDGAA